MGKGTCQGRKHYRIKGIKINIGIETIELKQ